MTIKQFFKCGSSFEIICQTYYNSLFTFLYLKLPVDVRKKALQKTKTNPTNAKCKMMPLLIKNYQS
jgi:hypothetical protein